MLRGFKPVALGLVIGLVGAGCASGGGGSSPSAGPVTSAGAGGDICTAPPKHEGTTLTFVSFGGVYQEAQRKGWLEPYTALTGVDFLESEESSNATIKAQVESGNVEWDVVDVGNDFGLDGNADLLEEIDYTLVKQDEILDGFATKYRVGDITYGVVLAYNTEQDGRRGPRGLGRLLRHDQDPGQARAVEVLHGRRARVRADGRRREAGRPVPARPRAGHRQARHDQGRHRVVGVRRPEPGAHRLG